MLTMGFRGAACVFSLAVLFGGSAIAQQAPTQADELIADAEKAVAKERFVDAALAYFSVVELFPQTEQSYRANGALGDLGRRFQSGEISADQAALFESSLPPIEKLNSAEAILILVDLYRIKADLAEAAGDTDTARAMHVRIRDAAWRAIQSSSSNPALVGLVWPYAESSDALGPQELAAARANLETYANTLETTVRSWICYWVVTHYKEESADNRDQLAARYQKILDGLESEAVQYLLNDPLVYDWVKAECLYGVGHAHFRLGQHTQALTAFEKVATVYPQEGIASVKSSYAAAVTQQLIFKNDPDAAIDAFNEHLIAYADSPYRAKSVLRIGNIEEKKGNFEAALEKYEAVQKQFPASAEAADATAYKEALNLRMAPAPEEE